MLKGCAARFAEDAPRSPSQDPLQDSPQNSPCTLLRFALWVAPPCAPYIGAAESTEIFLEILWGFLGCREVGEGGVDFWNSGEGLFKGFDSLWSVSGTKF